MVLKITILAIVLGLVAVGNDLCAQTTAFKYQGSLTDGANPANGSFQMKFLLFDAVSGGNQIGTTLADVPVTATNGVFSVSLDFGVSALNGANRWIEIAVRRNAGESYVTLTPREQITSSPYSVRTLSAAQADTALDSQKLGGVNANQFVQTTDVRLSDARTPLGGSTNYIQNTQIQQASSNFSVSGNGQIGGSMAVGTGFDAFYRLGLGGPVRSISPDSTHFVAQTLGGTNNWARFYMRTPNRSWFMGSSQNFNGDQLYFADETAGQTRMVITTGGRVGIGTTAPGAGLEVRGTGFEAGQRLTDNTSGNSLVLQSGSGIDLKVTGYNYGTAQAVPLYLSVDGANTVVGGNAAQVLGSFGVPKAMIMVDPNANIVRCYNGVTGTSSGNCGFTATRTNTGLYRIDFGFQVNNRLFSFAIRYQAAFRIGMIATSDDPDIAPVATVNQIYVITQGHDGNVPINSTFYVVVY